MRIVKTGHTGPLFKQPEQDGHNPSKCWAAPSGELFGCVSHSDSAVELLKSYYPQQSLDDPERTLISLGWVRVYSPGYYEINVLNGTPKRILLDLIATLDENQNVVVDVVENGIKTQEMTAGQFLDKYA